MTYLILFYFILFKLVISGRDVTTTRVSPLYVRLTDFLERQDATLP